MRLVLCDDHRLFAEPLAVALENRGHQVFVCSTPAEALSTVARRGPDVCVLDLRFADGDGDGIDAVAELRQKHPGCAVVVLSGSADEDDFAAALAAGAAAFLGKDQPVSAIFEALDLVLAGEAVSVSPGQPAGSRLADRARVRSVTRQLTARERDVLRGLVQGHGTQTIARELQVAPSTVRTHLQSVLFKLGVHTRLQAVALVARAGVDDEL
jgi:DNA-binding NarL/FixJ family response regulator